MPVAPPVSPLPALGIALVDRLTEHRAAGCAEQGADRGRSARRDQVAEHAAGKAADDQPCRAIVAFAIIAAVRTAIDRVVAAEMAGVIAIAAAIMAIGIVAAARRLAVIAGAAAAVPVTGAGAEREHRAGADCENKLVHFRSPLSGADGLSYAAPPAGDLQRQCVLLSSAWPTSAPPAAPSTVPVVRSPCVSTVRPSN